MLVGILVLTLLRALGAVPHQPAVDLSAPHAARHPGGACCFVCINARCASVICTPCDTAPGRTCRPACSRLRERPRKCPIPPGSAGAFEGPQGQHGNFCQRRCLYPPVRGRGGCRRCSRGLPWRSTAGRLTGRRGSATLRRRSCHRSHPLRRARPSRRASLAGRFTLELRWADYRRPCRRFMR